MIFGRLYNNDDEDDDKKCVLKTAGRSENFYGNRNRFKVIYTYMNI